jgi:hypothetical protein
MLLTLLGLILMMVPFGLIFCFKDRIRGLLYILTSLIAMHTVIALLTQALHVFTYAVILTSHILLAIVSIIFLIKNRKPQEKIKINWLAIIAFVIIFFELWSVHFNYSGLVTTTNGDTYVHNETLKYPYFSDEWIGVTLADYSIQTHSLPTINPLAGQAFVNPMIAHFSFLSELYLLLHLDPLTGSAFFSITTGFLVCFFIFLLLRVNLISNFLALIIALSVPFIVNSASLPGIWNLLPFITSFIALLIGLTLFSLKNFGFGALATVISLLFYPPMIVFILPSVILLVLNNRQSFNFKKILLILAGLVALTTIIILINAGQSSLTETTKIIGSYLVRDKLDASIPNLSPWLIMPNYLLLLAILGIFPLVKQKKYFLLAPFFTGIIFWIIYTFTKNVFIIDHYRVAMITSLLAAMSAGFGLNWFFHFLYQKYGPINTKLEKIVPLAILLSFFVLSFYYTERTNWISLAKLPNSPVTAYLTNEDLDIFKVISGQTFVAPSWKALVLAVATGNKPLETKASTLAVKKFSYENFTKMSCEEKEAEIIKKKIEYLYLKKIDCDFLVKINQSSEGLVLYKYQP